MQREYKVLHEPSMFWGAGGWAVFVKAPMGMSGDKFFWQQCSKWYQRKHWADKQLAKRLSH